MGNPAFKRWGVFGCPYGTEIRRRRYAGAKARCTVEAYAALKGRSSTVRSRVGGGRRVSIVCEGSRDGGGIPSCARRSRTLMDEVRDETVFTTETQRHGENLNKWKRRGSGRAFLDPPDEVVCGGCESSFYKTLLSRRRCAETIHWISVLTK